MQVWWAFVCIPDYSFTFVQVMHSEEDAHTSIEDTQLNVLLWTLQVSSVLCLCGLSSFTLLLGEHITSNYLHTTQS